MIKSSGALLALLAICGAAQATTLYPLERSCPVGGERYQSFGIGSTSRFGLRLDLRPVGPAAFLPMIECPNGFVVFKDDSKFTPAEIAELTPVVASKAYQDLRRTEPIAARVVLLLRALDVDEVGLRAELLNVAFQAEDTNDQAVRQKYLALAASAYVAFLAAHDKADLDWWVARLRVAEIARQQSRFDEAIQLVNGLNGVAPPGDGFLGRVANQIRARAQARDAVPQAYQDIDEKH